MRLLWMKSDYVLPPDTGGKIRTYNLMRQLNRLGSVTYLALKDRQDPDDEPEIRECASEVVTYYQPEERKSGPAFYARVLSGVLSPVPYKVAKYRYPDTLAFQGEFAARGSDGVILCDFLDMAENVDWSLPCPKVLFQHNVETMIWDRHYENETHLLKRAYFKFERRRMARYEREMCARFDLVLAVSEADKQVFRERFGVTRPIEVIETGVDTEYFAPREDGMRVPGKLVFTGSMDWLPNVDAMKAFVGEAYPRIRAKHPEVTLDIVGRRPSQEIRALAEGDASICVTGGVEDVRPYLAAGDLFIVPIRIGGGTRIKIYEAMGMKRPVVSTTIGAEGLPLADGEHIVLADGPPAFADAVCRLLEAPGEKDRIAAEGYRRVTERYGWATVAKKLHHVCEALL